MPRRSSAEIILAIQDIITATPDLTQQQIRSALASRGHHISQSQISRLLRQWGEHPIDTSPKPRLAIDGLTRQILRNEVMAVVLTDPGTASFVARFLDDQQHRQILATLAGEDTVLVIPRSVAMLGALTAQLQRWLL